LFHKAHNATNEHLRLPPREFRDAHGGRGRLS
jgi:hypothetical protein